MKSVKKPILAGVMITSLLLTSLTGCGAASASGDAKETSQDVSEDSSTSSENIFAFTEDCDMELASTTIVGRVTGISDNIISLDIADLSDVEFQGPGPRPEGEGGAPTEEQAPDGDAAPEKPEGDSSSPQQGEPPEKPADEQGSTDGAVPERPDKEDGARPDMKGIPFDLDSLIYVPGTLTIEDESILLTASERSLMSLFKGGDHMKGGMGDADSMPDLGSASDSSDSSSADSGKTEEASPEGSDPFDGDKSADDKRSPLSETEEPISLSELSEGNIVLITFDENGVITAIHVITNTDFLTQGGDGTQPADPQESGSQE